MNMKWIKSKHSKQLVNVKLYRWGDIFCRYATYLALARSRMKCMLLEQSIKR